MTNAPNKQQSKQQRLSKQLRTNLKRRKAQRSMQQIQILPLPITVEYDNL